MKRKEIFNKYNEEMKLLYSYEHVSCHNYDSGVRSLMEVKEMLEGEVWEISALENKILFVTEGQLAFSYANITNDTLLEGRAFLLPSGAKFKAKANTYTSISIVRLRAHIQLCDRYSLERLLKDEDINRISRQTYLHTNQMLKEYLFFLNKMIKDGLRCVTLFEIKVKELFFLLRGYYTKKELLGFFYPLLTNDTDFSNLILLNYHKVKTVRDLAVLTHYSVSGFEKRFKREFNIPPSQWLKEKRAKNIYHEINCSSKTFKEISLEYGFASPAHLNDFCKSYFGSPPGTIRKQKFLK